MTQIPEPTPQTVRRLSYKPLHNLPAVDVDAWAQQWFSGLSGIHEHSEEYADIAPMLCQALHLRPAERESDARDLSFGVWMLSLIGSTNPHNVDSGATEDRWKHEQWKQTHELALLIGRQVVRVTLEEAEAYAAFRIERELSGTDYLTGIPNRRGLAQRLSDQYGITDYHLRRDTSDQPLEPLRLTHFYWDANGFKWINDQLGHRIGDAAIQETAWEIQQLTRWSDSAIMYRHGGDEFGVIIEGLTEAEVQDITDRAMQQQIAKATSEPYRMAMGAIELKLHEARQDGRLPRMEARLTTPPQADTAARRPYHILYIDGEPVTPLQTIITLATGAESADVANMYDIETLRHSSEADMDKAKQHFYNSIQQ